VEFGYIQASHSHFPRCHKVLPLSIIKHELPARTVRRHTLPCFCYHTALHHAPPPVKVLVLPHAALVPSTSGEQDEADNDMSVRHVCMHVCTYLCTMSLSLIHSCTDPPNTIQYPEFQACGRYRLFLACINLPPVGLAEASSSSFAYRASTLVN
jgi:hypothetical protein